MKKYILKFYLFILCFSFTQLFAQNTNNLPPELDKFVEKVMKEFQVPGLSVAIVNNGQIVLTKGYGIKNLGKPDKVDENTLFGIASNSKAFTATAIGMLVEEGKLNWDDPVIKHLPAFRLSDPFITANITIKDLLVHRSGLGLGAGDLLWWPPSKLDKKEIINRLKYLPIANGFRYNYAYDNVLFNVAGEVIESVTGMTWEDFISERIFKKTGMNNSYPCYPKDISNLNISGTHAIVEGKLIPVAPMTKDNINPAAGITSSAVDMAKWIKMHLDSGKTFESGLLFKSSITRELWSLVTPIKINTPPKELQPLQMNFNGAALGFFVRDFRKYKMVQHSGGYPGYLSLVTMIPEKKLGVVVLTNQESSEAFYSITYHILDFYLNAPQFDWLKGYKTRKARLDSISTAEEKQRIETKNMNSKPSLSLSSYAGTYKDKWYGDILIEYHEGKLLIDMTNNPDLKGTLEHWQYDTFIAKWTNREMRADAFVTFCLTPEGEIKSAEMEAVSSDTDFSFDFHDLKLIPKK